MNNYVPLKNYEGVYLINKNGKIKTIEGKIIKEWENFNDYMRITLFKSGKKKHHYIHRLVAKQFIPNPFPKKYNEINHKDLNRKNNKISNLECCDHVYNCENRGPR